MAKHQKRQKGKHVGVYYISGPNANLSNAIHAKEKNCKEQCRAMR